MSITLRSSSHCYPSPICIFPHLTFCSSNFDFCIFNRSISLPVLRFNTNTSSYPLHCMPSHLTSLHLTSSYYFTPLHSTPSYFTMFILLPLSIPHNVNVRLYIKKKIKRIVRTVHTARQYNVTVQCRNYSYNTANLNLI